MKKRHISVLFTLLYATFTFAQSPNYSVWDTIFISNLESNGPFEPANLDNSIPTGFDMTWINYDEDGFNQTCDTVTHGWYGRYESSYPNETDNFCFTSCSFVNDYLPYNPCLYKNRNWLIMPPITITGNNAKLEWRSASYYGPFGLDGYKVMVSTTSNLTESFTDTIFKAAEMIKPFNPNNIGSLNPNNFLFSEGYIQADKYTLNDYFIFDATSDFVDFLHGKLEPHSANLSAYTGQTIYIAFLHDSQCDFQLQLDDIVVIDNITDAIHEKTDIVQFGVHPNPIEEEAFLDVSFANPTKYQVTITDIHGKVVQSIIENNNAQEIKKSITLNLKNLPSGTYFCNLTTDKGHVSKKILKM
jgi:Secretion system C-terminal sorting domain/Cleaved Adhesin Domain